MATYPLAGAYALTRGLAKESGAVTVPVSGDGVAFYRANRPTNQSVNATIRSSLAAVPSTPSR